MIIYFGTVVRAAPINKGGSTFKLDWDTKTILEEVPAMPTNPDIYSDPNVRGNVRGVRGIQVLGDEVFAADYHTINVFDRDLNLRRKISHGLMVNLHETQIVGSSIWVTSTPLDAVLKYRLDDGSLDSSFWPREMPEFQQSLGIWPLEIDKEADNRLNFLESASFKDGSHLHLNAVCEFRGDVYALFHSRNVVVNLSKGTIVIKDANLKHAHNLIIEEPGVVYVNDTHRTVVRQYDLESGNETRAINIREMRGIKPLLFRSLARAVKEIGLTFFSRKWKATARPFYLRGLAINEDYIFAGFSPATIVRIDKKTGKLVDYYFHSTDLRDCIHGLTCG